MMALPLFAALLFGDVPTPNRVNHLIEELGSKQFRTREGATLALEAVGEPALAALNKAVLDSPDAEVRRRAVHLIRVIEARPREALRCFSGHSAPVLAVAFAPGNRLAISGGEDRTIRLWDCRTGEGVRTLRGHAGAVTSLAVSPDGKAILSGSSDKTLRLWEVSSGKELRLFTGLTAAIHCVAFSPDGKHAVSGGEPSIVRVWDIGSGKVLRRFTGHYTSPQQIAFSPDGCHVVSSGGGEGGLRVWQFQSGEQECYLRGHLRGSCGLAFSSDGKKLLSVGDEGDARIWDVVDSETEGKELSGWDDSASLVHAVKFVRDTPLILSGGKDVVRLWDGKQKKDVRVFAGHKGMVECVAFSADARLALSAGEDGTVRVWELPK